MRESIDSLGFATRSFFNLLGVSPGALRRPALISEQIHFIGNYSLVIITVSGLFVGMVLGLQGYYTLTTYGAEQKLGLLVALSLMRELGPVVTALLFAGRAGTSLTAEIGLMKAGEQLSAMEMMAINPIQRVLAPRFWAGVIAMPVLAADFQRGRHARRLPGRRAADRRRRGRVLVADAGRRRRARTTSSTA